MNQSPFLKIKSDFVPPPGHSESLTTYILSIEQALRSCISEKHLPLDATKEEFFAFLNTLPLITHSPINDKTTMMSASLICKAPFTVGVGRYMCEFYNRHIIPGKQLPIVTVRSIRFAFSACPDRWFLFNEAVIEIGQGTDLAIIKHNLAKLANDLRINILAVSHARQIVSTKPLTLEQKKHLIQENIASLLNKGRNFESDIFDQMQDLLFKARAEQTSAQMRDELLPLLEMQPTVLDRNIYLEMQHYVLSLKDHYTARRDLKHLMRMVSTQYTFRKVITNALVTSPQKRHISIKLLRTKLHETDCSIPVLGVLVGINLMRENELFEERHLLQAIQTCIPEVVKVEGSGIIDQRQGSQVRTLYLEVRTPASVPFSSEAIGNLQKQLPQELKSQIESISHPIFVHRNEEEIMRSILELSKQLKYVNDLPQVVINFHKQNNFDISFTVILLRLRPQGAPSLKEFFATADTRLKIVDCDSKIVGVLRKKIPKEANVFEVHMGKKEFLRKDYSLDIYKARLSIFEELSRLLGEIRDYNGGMISQQFAVLRKLKKALLQHKIKNDFLLENFFYSISPTYMQSMIDPHLLEVQFRHILRIIEHDYAAQPVHSLTEKIDNHYLIMVGATAPSIKEFIFKAIELFVPTSEFSHSFVNAYDISCIGFILHCHEKSEYERFLSLVRHGIEQWAETTQGTLTLLHG